MAKYLLTFEKKDMMKYLSHLDLLRLFKRAFRSAEVNLLFSEGFNPHPRMAFGQPLSLGYESLEEWLEIETEDDLKLVFVQDKINQYLPPGIQITGIKKQNDGNKSIASTCQEAHYHIVFPIGPCPLDADNLLDSFMTQKEILVEKSSKKHKEVKLVNIKPMIRSVTLSRDDDFLIMKADLDAGSQSNLSPELLIQGFLRFSQLQIPRHQIKVLRTKLIFQNN
jgi:radical SAM-linked protein